MSYRIITDLENFMRPVCLIVGSGEGLGKALSAKFSFEGFDIALISRSEESSEPAFTAASKARSGVKVQYFHADAGEPKTIEKTVSQIQQEMGAVEVLIYNVRDEFERCDPIHINYYSLEKVFRLEVVGALAAAKSVVPHMLKRGQGTIFFSSATAAFRGSSTFPIYSIGKFGLRALSQSFSKAYSKEGIHFVHVRLDCNLDVPIIREMRKEQDTVSQLAATEAIAESYWLAYLQPRSAWSNEIELRPFTEEWTY